VNGGFLKDGTVPVSDDDYYDLEVSSSKAGDMIIRGWVTALAEGSNIKVSVYFELMLKSSSFGESEAEGEASGAEVEALNAENCYDEASDMEIWNDEPPDHTCALSKRDGPSMSRCLMCARGFELQVTSHDCSGTCVRKNSIPIEQLATPVLFMCEPAQNYECLKWASNTLPELFLKSRQERRQEQQIITYFKQHREEISIPNLIIFGVILGILTIVLIILIWKFSSQLSCIHRGDKDKLYYEDINLNQSFQPTLQQYKDDTRALIIGSDE